MWKVYNVIGMVRRTTFICSSTCPAEHVEQRGANEGIDNSEIQNENEQTINRLYIKWLKIGMDSITEDDKDIIHGLALQCPYNGGTAVYKARSMWATYEPALMYDDIKLCNNAGVNKANNNSSTKGLFDDENKYLSNLKASVENKIVLENELIIFPNPSNSQINIRYKESRNTQLQIVNVVGIILKEISLPKDIQQVSTLVNELNTGIYIYRQVYGKEILNTGKLIIE